MQLVKYFVNEKNSLTLHDPEYQGIPVLWNVCNCLPVNPA